MSAGIVVVGEEYRDCDVVDGQLCSRASARSTFQCCLVTADDPDFFPLNIFL